MISTIIVSFTDESAACDHVYRDYHKHGVSNSIQEDEMHWGVKEPEYTLAVKVPSLVGWLAGILLFCMGKP